jgi:hypothetical protein
MKRRQPARPERFAIEFVKHFNSTEDPEIRIDKFYQFLINYEFQIGDKGSYMEAVVDKVRLIIAVKTCHESLFKNN